MSDAGSPRFWIGVVSRSHVQRGVAGGFAQLSHGKEQPLRRLTRADWLVYYSPKTSMDCGEPLQAFTAIGQVRDDIVYEHPMSDDFIPFRRNIDYKSCHEAPIHPLLHDLSFITDKQHWGYPLRNGLIEIPISDITVIANAMCVDDWEKDGD